MVLPVCFLAAAALLLGILAPAGPPAIYVMRHLDTPAGERDPDLTAEGQRNAERLARWFDGKPLAAIYVSDFRRTRQTAASLSQREGVATRIYDPADTAALLDAVRKESGPVLIVGHSNTVPDIVEQLGGARPAPLSHDDFGSIWILEGEKFTRKEL